MNLTDGHEYKITCWVIWCTSLPHSPTVCHDESHSNWDKPSFACHTRHILTACVLDRYSFVSLTDVLSLAGSFLVPSSMYSLVTKAQTTPKLQTDTVFFCELGLPPRWNGCCGSFGLWRSVIVYQWYNVSGYLVGPILRLDRNKNVARYWVDCLFGEGTR
jgi:hypothetical protein